MQSKASTPQEYLDSLPADRKPAMMELRKVILKNLPKGFSEQMSYGMLGYVVPHSIFPDGYHCDPKLPLPFICLASQKNFVALYHMGIYADPKLLKWFTTEYPKQSKSKLDMGKSCIRFKKLDEIPFDLIGELASKMTPQDWIERYTSILGRREKTTDDRPRTTKKAKTTDDGRQTTKKAKTTDNGRRTTKKRQATDDGRQTTRKKTQKSKVKV